MWLCIFIYHHLSTCSQDWQLKHLHPVLSLEAFCCRLGLGVAPPPPPTHLDSSPGFQHFHGQVPGLTGVRFPGRFRPQPKVRGFAVRFNSSDHLSVDPMICQGCGPPEELGKLCFGDPLRGSWLHCCRPSVEVFGVHRVVGGFGRPQKGSISSTC